MFKQDMVGSPAPSLSVLHIILLSRDGGRDRDQSLGQDDKADVSRTARADNGHGAPFIGVTGIRAVLIVVGGGAAEDAHEPSALHKGAEQGLLVGHAVAVRIRMKGRIGAINRSLIAL